MSAFSKQDLENALDIMAPRVKAGARLLDSVKPGWALEIDTKTLCLGSSRSCILAQLFGNYELGLERLSMEPSSREPQRYGFMIDYRASLINAIRAWSRLNWLWYFEIKARRGNDAGTNPPTRKWWNLWQRMFLAP